MKKQQRPLLITILFLSCLLLAYTVVRAAVLSMTHDESTTFWLRGVNVLSCFFSADCWGNANIHPLNTWMLKRSEALFGISELSLRLPNLLAHVLYLYVTARLILRLNRHFLVSLAGFMLLNFNPYLLDFFSLARGYGLSIGLTMASLGAYFYFLRQGRWQILALSYGFAFLAILANFVALNYLVSLWGAVFLMSLLQPSNDGVKIRVDWRKQLWINAVPLAFSILLAILLYTPIQHLQGGGEFNFGAQNFRETFTSLVGNSLYGVNYFSKGTGAVFNTAYTVLLLASLVGAFWCYFRKPGEYWRHLYLATAFLFLMSCLVMILQHYILGSNYLLDRKLLIFMLYSALLIYFLIYGLAENFGEKYGLIAGILFTLAIIYHSIRTANFEYCREWWYDRYTRDMVDYLDALSLPENEQIDLGVDWVFQPSTSFYLHDRKMEHFITPPLDSGIQTDGRYDFYYVFGGGYEQLKEQYEIEKPFPAGMYLLRRKGFGE